MQLEPLFGKVVVKPLDAVKKTSSGLILPDCAQAGVCEAKVLWAAEGINIKVGSTVLYCKAAGLRYECSELSVVILKSADVLALVYNE